MEIIKNFIRTHKKLSLVLAIVISLFLLNLLIKLFVGYYSPKNREDWAFATYEYWAETWDSYEGRVGGVVVEYDGDEEVVFVPKYIDGERVMEIGRYSFDYADDDIRVIIVPEGVKKISHRAFWGCDNLELLFLPMSISEVDEGSLQCHSRNLKIITFNPKVLAVMNAE